MKAILNSVGTAIAIGFRNRRQGGGCGFGFGEGQQAREAGSENREAKFVMESPLMDSRYRGTRVNEPEA